MMKKTLTLLLGFAVVLQACGSTDDSNNLDVGTNESDSSSEDCEGSDCSTCIDNDNDGYGSGCAEADCNDSDPLISPSNAEVCGDHLDNDCDGIVDNRAVCQPCNPSCTVGEDMCSGDLIARCDDSNGCAMILSPVSCSGGLSCRSGVCTEVCLDLDNDGFAVDCDGVEDCNDEHADVYPGAPEICDDLDNNCDTRVDENFVCNEPCENECTQGDSACTSDAVGLTVCQLSPNGCTSWSGTIPCSEGLSCENAICVETPVCVDPDGDGFGPACDLGNDCRGQDPTSNPNAEEKCDGIDNNCNGVIDEGNVCANCEISSISSPNQIEAGGYGVICNGPAYWQVEGDSIVLVGSENGPISVEAGSGSSGTFEPLQTGETLGDATEIFVPADATLLRIVAPNATRYHIAEITNSSNCSDSFEPNNSPAAATLLGDPPFALSASICENDFDYYQLSTSPGQIIALSVAYNGSLGRLETHVLRNGAEVSPSFAGPATAEGFANGVYTFFRTDLPGEYAVTVRGQDTTVPYVLSVNSWNEPCVDDSSETNDGLDNDTLATAHELSASTLFSGVLCPGDFDAISVGHFENGHLSGTLSFENANLDGLMLHDSLRGLSQVAETDGNTEIFDNNLSTEGDYYFLFFGRSARDSANYTFIYQ